MIKSRVLGIVLEDGGLGRVREFRLWSGFGGGVRGLLVFCIGVSFGISLFEFLLFFLGDYDFD